MTPRSIPYGGTTAIQAFPDFFFPDHGRSFICADSGHHTVKAPSLKPQAELLRTALDDFYRPNSPGALTGYA